MKEIYFDNSATTQTDPRVAAEIARVMTEVYGNPSSLHHKGLEAQLLLEEAARRVGALLGVPGESVLFTSGGTESNNLAIFGAAATQKRRGNHIITTAFEHASVLAPIARLGAEGMKTTLIKPDSHGSIDPEELLAAVTGETILVSCMVVNNEVGAILPYEHLAAAIKEKNPHTLVHCDAVQAYGKLPLKVGKTQVDLMSVSGHKIHAPKGVGALYLKKGVRIQPLLYGGSQQRGLRPGTENLPLACGMGLAAQTMGEGLTEAYAKTEALHAHLTQALSRLPGVFLNTPPNGSPYILNISLPGYRSEVLLHALEEHGIYVSSASACTKGEKSHVLASMGLPPAHIDGALRLSFSRENTTQEADAFLTALQSVMARLRRVG